MFACQKTPSWNFELESSNRSWTQVPVTIEIPEDLQGHEQYTLYSVESELYIPVQKDGEAHVMFMPESPLPPNTKRTYVLQADTVNTFPSSVNLS